MKVRVNKVLLEKSGIWKKDSSEESRFEKYSMYAEPTQLFVIDMSRFTEKEMSLLQKTIEGAHEWRALAHKLKVFKRLTVDPTGTDVARLEHFEPAFKAFFQGLPNKWVFKEGMDGHMLPYYVEKATYYKAHRSQGVWYPAYVTIKLHPGRDLTLYQENMGENVAKILEKEKYYVENPELVATYKKEIELYLQEKSKVGKQFRAIGHAEFSDTESRWGGRAATSMERDGRASKVVMDNDHVKAESDRTSRDEDDEDDTVSTEYWQTRDDINERERIERAGGDEAEELEALETVVPLHPFVECFDLVKHHHIQLHISNLRPYVYDETVGAKLVLPKEKKDLVGILVEGSNMLMEDIIEGKTGGIIVLATGIPGTGKTLTAEVYAEAVKKPLYVVQCSQLGTSAETIEQELSKVLTRASRWGAILLIDEADVYVRERGTDIEQNAIVGVFLRVLEYYRGVLFMTSNRATILDDAIMSRATAHITYETPDRKERARIWEVLSKQFNLKLVGSFDTYAKEFEITGRTIKNLLKLSMLISLREKKSIDLKLVRYAAQFLDGVEKGGRK